MTSDESAGQSGFTLIEVIVALAVLALTLGVVFQSFSLGLRSMSSSEAYLRAVEVAESRLAMVGRDVERFGRELKGKSESGLTWSVTIEPFEDPEETLPDPDDAGVRLYEIVVRVATADGRTVTLKTLRLGPPS